ncbi:MAG: hypothetical protein RBG13Loki_0874, partial [Promethearchaeota archaeon CR_4]
MRRVKRSKSDRSRSKNRFRLHQLNVNVQERHNELGIKQYKIELVSIGHGISISLFSYTLLSLLARNTVLMGIAVITMHAANGATDERIRSSK